MPPDAPPPGGPRRHRRARSISPPSVRRRRRFAPALLALALGALLSACGRSAGADTKPFRTVVLEPATLQAMAAYDGGDALLFEPPDRIDEIDGVATDGLPDQIGDLEAGDVLVAPPSDAAPYGLLRRVTAVVRSREGVRVVTEQATLEDAVNGSDLEPGLYTLEVPIDLSGAEPLPRLGALEPLGSEAGARSFFAALPADLYSYDAALAERSYAREIERDWRVPIFGERACAPAEQRRRLPDAVEEDFRACVSADLSLRIDVRIGVRWIWFVPVPTIDEFVASIRGRVAGDLRFGLEAAHGANVSIPYLTQRFHLGTLRTAPLVAWLGPIPVPSTPVLEFYVDVEGGIQVEARLAIDRWVDYRTAMRAELGVRFRRGTGWRPIRSVDFSPGIDPSAFRTPILDADVATTVALSLSAPDTNFALYLFGVLGPAVSAEATSGFRYTLSGRKRSGTIDFGLGLYLGLAGRIPIVAYRLPESLMWRIVGWSGSVPL